MSVSRNDIIGRRRDERGNGVDVGDESQSREFTAESVVENKRTKVNARDGSSSIIFAAASRPSVARDRSHKCVLAECLQK